MEKKKKILYLVVVNIICLILYYITKFFLNMVAAAGEPAETIFGIVLIVVLAATCVFLFIYANRRK